tara:strand:+ start:296 stop:505 length:210 start_codon:yes stop_codon:yes gene_type:complete
MSQIIEHNVETGEITSREMTKEEIAEVQKAKENADNFRAEAQSKIDAKESALAKLAALGLTPEEISAIS